MPGDRRHKPAVFSFRTSLDQAAVLRAAAAGHGMSAAQYARHKACEAAGLQAPDHLPAPSGDKAVLAEVLRLIRNAETNLAEVVQAFQRQAMPEDVERVRQAIAAHRASRDALKRALRR